MRFRPSPPAIAALIGAALGLTLTTVWSAADARRALPGVRELQPIERLTPMHALPRTALVLAMAQARAHLAEDRPWAAWMALQEHLAGPEEAAPQAALLAARAAAAWGGWDHVRGLLEGERWLDHTENGEGWFLLGRAAEEEKRWTQAEGAYRRFAALSSGTQRGVAEARLGRVLRERGDPREAGAAFGAAARDLPAIADWMLALQAEALAATGGLSEAALPLAAGSGSAARLRRARAEAAGWIVAGDAVRAIEQLQRESQLLAGQGASAEAASLSIELARLLGGSGRLAGARELLRASASDSSVPAEARARAATLLGEIVGGRGSVAEELARAAAYEAAKRPGLAARSLRVALEGGAPDDAATRLRLGRLLYEARDFPPARAALLAAAARIEDREQVAEAELLAARARFRGGDRKGGLAELHTLTERRRGTAAAGTALFVLGDETNNLQQAINYYRRASTVEGSPEAREALFRFGDRSLKNKDPATALRAWGEYVARYPSGEETARIAYQAGLMHARAGRDAQARAMYTAALLAEPLSYYALRAGERLGADPLTPVLAEPRPWVGITADGSDAEAALARLDLLREVGLSAEWKEELEATLRRLDRRPTALLAVAEGLRDRGYAGDAVRLGWRLREKRGGEWDGRLLRVVFPLPYQTLIEREAQRARLDPMLLAGLIRQESMFRSDARSRVGATGLSQIMPATGRWLAPQTGVAAFEERLLAVPEVNVRMGARYLADLLRRYDGARDLALAGYNAGPGRADRWRHELGHASDIDGFREKIPFDETRHYVTIVLRNAAVYQQLYGDAGSPAAAE
ncbi:MAG: transglycosylase SLT domain-containing protein [Longimicrobiaceae bacterium]